MTPLEPAVSFFSSCCNAKEKKFILASLLPNELNQETVAMFAKAFSVKHCYVEECFQERIAKLHGGIKYEITSTQRSEGQVNLDEVTKRAIVDMIYSDSQLWPSMEKMKAQIPILSVKDRVLSKFYEEKCQKNPKRGTPQFQADRKVLPVSFEYYWRTTIKKLFPQAGFQLSTRAEHFFSEFTIFSPIHFECSIFIANSH